MPGLRSALERLEREAATWREEPMKRLAARNMIVAPLRRRQFHSFGKGSFVHRPEWLYGASHIAIGDGVVILRGSWLSVERVAWDRSDPVIEIRDHAGMRMGCTISAASSILIEEHVTMGAFVSVIDSKHTRSVDNPSPMSGPFDAAPIRIGQGTWLADRVTVAAGADIGERCAVAPNAVVSGTVPDYSIVVGNPGRVVASTRV